MNDISKEVAVQEQDSFFATVERLAVNPDVDVAKIKEFMEMQEHILDRNAKQAFNNAMTRTQQKIGLVVAASDNVQTRSKYADLKTILIQIKPIYTEEGFSLMFYELDTTRDNQKKIGVDIMHSQGHTEKRFGYFSIQTTGMAGKAMMTQIHGEGSAIQYGRRYLTCMIFNIPVGIDDNGNAAGIEYINTEQIKTIKKLIKEREADEALFLTYMKAESLETIPAKEFDNAVFALKSKKKPVREPGDEG